MSGELIVERRLKQVLAGVDFQEEQGAAFGQALAARLRGLGWTEVPRRDYSPMTKASFQTKLRSPPGSLGSGEFGLWTCEIISTNFMGDFTEVTLDGRPVYCPTCSAAGRPAVPTKPCEHGEPS